MAKAAGVTAVAAGWGHTVQPIQVGVPSFLQSSRFYSDACAAAQDYMRRECAQYFETVQALVTAGHCRHVSSYLAHSLQDFADYLLTSRASAL